MTNKKKLSDEEKTIFYSENLEAHKTHLSMFVKLAKNLDMTYQDLVVVAGGLLRFCVRYSIRASKEEGIKVTKKDKDIFLQELGEYIMK